MASDTALKIPIAAFGVCRSFSGRRWRLRQADEAMVRALADAHGISTSLARILAGRGIASETVPDLLNPTLKRLLPEPYLLADMERAVARVESAIEADEKIAVFGDYDVDGSCSAALVHDYLSALRKPPRIYIPDRMSEGYGPSPRAMQILRDEGASLVITVDCGATAHAAFEKARDIGLDAVVLDHHATEALPPALAHVNPNRAGDTSGLHHLCAAGVTFLFLVALNRSLRNKGWFEKNGIAPPDLMESLDLVGLATVCDVVPLQGVNRALARSGLARISELKRKGLAALARVSEAKTPFTAYHLGFVFGPRINAGGRVGKCSLGVELLTATDDGQSEDVALLLDTHNRERQAIEAMILEEAIAMADAQANAPFLLAAQDGWHPGVVGIVAGRLKDRFAKPAFVAGFEGGLGRGSARSVPGVDIGAIIRGAKDAGVIEHGGGHAMAAGFGLYRDQLEGFSQFLAARFADLSDAVADAFDLDLDALVSPSGATPQFVSEMERLGPFGAGNAEPLVAVPDARVAFADIVGKDHVRFRLTGGDGARLDGIAFRQAHTALGQGILGARSQTIHAAGRLRADSWNGRIRVQLQLEDAAPAGA
ncbi:MAG TPA: single-stranded-DNA-specific exonuclease RecJ [Rhizomicrobium sp.]|nr:single-stranded-DNA-specific exonuclease RecJ [Rhizomicrobium sp.]